MSKSPTRRYASRASPRMTHTPATASTQRLRLDCVAVSTLVLNGRQPSPPAKIESATCQACICALSLRRCVDQPGSRVSTRAMANSPFARESPACPSTQPGPCVRLPPLPLGEKTAVHRANGVRQCPGSAALVGSTRARFHREPLCGFAHLDWGECDRDARTWSTHGSCARARRKSRGL